jgi:hypothetical protein
MATGGGRRGDQQDRRDQPIGTALGAMVAEGLTGQSWIKPGGDKGETIDRLW